MGIIKNEEQNLENSAERKYWHELPQEEIEELKEKKVTFREILERYKQPSWCGYPEAISGTMGCWSLCDLRPGGLRTKISKDFCKNCDEFIKEENND